MIEEDRVCCAGDRHLGIRVPQHDIRAFPAEFQSELLEITCRCMHDELADFGRACEGHFVDAVMSCQRRPRRLPESGYYVDHAVWHASFSNELREEQRG